MTHAINSVDPGGIINIVGHGQQFHYNELVTINKGGITIQAADINNKPVFAGSCSTTFVNARAVINWSGIQVNCTVNGIEIINITAHDNLMGIWVHGDGNTISNCKLSNMKRSGIVIYGNSNIIEDNIIENITGVIIGNNRLKGNNISIEAYYPSICEPPCGTVSNNNILRYNKLRNNPTHFGVNIFPNTSDFNQNIQSGNKIYNNWIENTGGAIYTRYQENLEIYNNILINNTYSDFWGTEGSAIKFDEHPIYHYVHSTPLSPDGNNFSAKIYNNVIAGNDIMGINNKTSDKICIYNNIFFNNGHLQGNYSEKGNIIWGQNLRTDLDTINNNIYYGIERWRYNSTNFTTSWATWQGYNHDINGHNGIDPQFVDVVNKNYSISPSSIAKNNGKLVTEVTTDYDKNPRPYWEGGIDIGAFELPEATIRIGAEGVTTNFPVDHTIEIVNGSTYWQRTGGSYVISSDNQILTSVYTSTGNVSTLNHIDEMEGYYFKWMKKNINDPEPPMGRGFYKVTNDLDPTKYFYLDMRDGSTKYNPNIYVQYNSSSNLYRFNLNQSWNNNIPNGSIARIWDLASDNINGTYNTLNLASYWINALLWYEESEYVRLVWGPYPAEEKQTVSGYNLYMNYHLYNALPDPNQWELLYSAGSAEYEFSDEKRIPGNGDLAMSYKVRAIVDNDEIESNIITVRLVDLAKGNSGEKILPIDYVLNQNYPNPFNPSTKISFSIKKDDMVTLKIFDILGREVTTLIKEQLNAGNHTINFDGYNLASGIYFYKITSGSFSSVKKFQLLK